MKATTLRWFIDRIIINRDTSASSPRMQGYGRPSIDQSYRIMSRLQQSSPMVGVLMLLHLLSLDGHQAFTPQHRVRHSFATARFGWLENFFEPQKASSREIQYPEQYPATYELNDVEVEEDKRLAQAKLVRPLLKNTQLQSRPLRLVYDSQKNGWTPVAFHRAVDGKGAAIVLATTAEGRICGGYNPKGFASLGGARPSVAAFLFYERDGASGKFQKLRKVGGGGLACARDDPNFGISFGPDALVIGLQPGRERIAQSKLGPYYERGPQDLPSLFGGGVAKLTKLKVLVGCYNEGEDIPYSGGVLDMTSG